MPIPSKSLRPELKVKRRQRRFALLAGLWRLACAVFLLYAIRELWLSDQWQWEPGAVEINGANFTDTDRLKRQLSFDKGAPLYRIKTTLEDSQLEAFPSIKKISIRRYLFPARIELTVVEREPFLRLKKKGYYIDREGIVFKGPGNLLKSNQWPQTTLDYDGQKMSSQAFEDLKLWLQLWNLDHTLEIALLDNSWWISSNHKRFKLGGVGDNFSKRIPVFNVLKLRNYPNLDFIDVTTPDSPSMRVKQAISSPKP
jgi:cell division septal protein FtsQ